MHNRFGREDIRRRMSQRGFGQDRDWEHQGTESRGGQRRENEAYDDDRYAQEQGYERGDYESGRQRAEEQGRRFMQETGGMRRHDSDRQSGYRGGAADDDPRWQYGGGSGGESYGGQGRRERSGWSGGDVNDRGGFGGSSQRGFGGYAGSGSSQGGRSQGGFGGGQHAGRGPSDYRRNDERIREDVCDELTDDSHLDATYIQVKVENGEVTLTGTVADRQQKRRAEDIAEGARGVSDVRNELRVQNESQSGSSQDRQQQSKSGASPKNI